MSRELDRQIATELDWTPNKHLSSTDEYPYAQEPPPYSTNLNLAYALPLPEGYDITLESCSGEGVTATMYSVCPNVEHEAFISTLTHTPQAAAEALCRAWLKMRAATKGTK